MTVNVTKPAVNVREKLAELDKPSGIAGEAMLRAETPQEQFNLIGAGRRNIFLNGNYQISQRGDYTSAVDGTNDAYFVDRWKIRNSHGTASDMSFQIITNDLPPNLSYGRVAKCTANAAYTNVQHFGFRQLIEKYQELAGKTVTYSAWVKSNVPTYLWIWEEGGSNINASSDPHPGDGSWKFMTVTTTIRSSGNTAISSYITTYGNALSSGDYHMSTQHQLELGKVATPFEHRSYGEELALCQRYYQRSAASLSEIETQNLFSGDVTSGQDYYASHHFNVPMRANSSITLSNGSSTNFGSRVAVGTAYGFRTSATATGSGRAFFRDGWTAEAEL